MSACFPCPPSLQPGVRESSDFDSRPAAFRPEEEECVILQGAIMVAKQRSVAISEIKWPLLYSLVECRNRGKLSLRLIIQRSDFANILYCPVACYTERIN